MGKNKMAGGGKQRGFEIQNRECGEGLRADGTGTNPPQKTDNTTSSSPPTVSESLLSFCHPLPFCFYQLLMGTYYFKIPTSART